MALIASSYGKGRVRVMRVHREGDYNEVRELTVQPMLEGEFDGAYTAGDNRTSIATDTMKNICYIVARENLRACAEEYAAKLGERFLARYPQVSKVTVRTWETSWRRAVLDGAAHPHSFTLEANGRPTARVAMTRGAVATASGIEGFTFLKSTASGWEDFVQDEYTTLGDTHDRLAATAMDAEWAWEGVPGDYPAVNARIVETMLTVFGTTYSKGVQDSLFRMGRAVLDAVPEVATVRMACPNKHYIPTNLDRFGLSADNCVFVCTDEPHGQIECTVGR